MYKNILVPMDLGHENDVDFIMGVARKLLDESGKITVLHVVEAIPSYIDSHLPSDYREASQSKVLEILHEQLSAYSNIDIQVVIGHSGRTIQNHAVQHKHDCIIMASHRPGIQDYFLGSTAAWVVRHSTCSVHVIR